MSESLAVIVAAFIAAGAALWIGWIQYAALQHQNKMEQIGGHAERD